MPKISVIIPVYNVQKYLRQCLDSVLNQTFADFEIICVNDGSTDDSGKILLEYADKDNRIKIITQENKGASEARNSGLKLAQGEYIYFLDSDDFIHPQLLEICYTLAEKEQAEQVSFCLCKKVIDRETISFPQYPLDTLSYIATDTPLYYRQKRGKYRIFVNAVSRLCRKELISDLSFIPGITMEDYPFTYACLAKHPKTVILNIPLYYYVYNPVSITKKQLSVKNIRDYHIGLSSIIDIYERSSQKEKNFVLRTLFPSILKQQWERIVDCPSELQSELCKPFIEELKDLKQKGWLSWRGHKLSRYLKYRKLISGN
jgi:glycosyltransferase involved in cell wall biosynthesis